MFLFKTARRDGDFYSEIRCAAETLNAPDIHISERFVGIRILSCLFLSFVIGCYERLLY